MNQNFRSFLLIVCFGFLVAPLALSQGLTDGFFNGKKNYTLVLGAGYENNPTYLAGKRELDLDKPFQNINVFAAYGLTNQLDIYVAAAYVKSDNEEAFQDARIVLKYKLFEARTDNFKFSAQFASGISFPLSDYQTEGINAIGQRATGIPSRLLLHIQKNDGCFLTVQSGYDYKFDPVPDAYASSLKIGLALSTFYLDAFLDFQNSVNGKDYRGRPAPNNFRELEVDFLRTGVTFFKPFNEQIGAFVNGSYTLDGRNVGLGPAVNLGITFKSSL
jgi:hypothetical protein